MARAISAWWRKQLGFARLARRELFASPGDLFGNVFFMAVIVGIFSALWRSAAEFGLPSSLTSRQLVWYLAITEWLALSQPSIHFQIATEIRRGDVAYALQRPVSYLSACFARAVGELALRLAVLAPAALLVGWFFAGGLPSTSAALAQAAAFGLGAALVAAAFRVLIGLCAFWLQDVMPLHWIWQKLGFVLGGLMLPLEFLPASLQRLAHYTPFPCLLYGPAAFVIGSGQRARLALELAVWFLFAAASAGLMFGRARQRLELNGG